MRRNISNNAINAVGIFFLVVLIIVCSCTNEALVESQEVCFEQEVLPLFIANCTASGCHNAVDRKGGFVLEDYLSIVSKGVVFGDYKASQLYKVLNAIGPNAMPKPPFERLQERDIITIARWIEQGARNTKCGTSCDTTAVTYSQNIRGIMKTYCDGCHTGSNPLGGINYNTYAGVKITVDNGSLVGAINHQRGFVAMPQGSKKMPDCFIRQIEKWIRDGAPNN